MSLNGLDATVVNEAYQSAFAEGGGWLNPLISLLAEQANREFLQVLAPLHGAR